MSEVAVAAKTPTPMQYLEKALGGLRKLGLVPEKTEEAPIVGLLEKISDLDPDRIVVITRTLAQMTVFNEVVREQISQMDIAQRYEKIAQGFNSIRDDAKRMVDQLSDGTLDIFERATKRLDEDCPWRHRNPLRRR